MKDLKNVTFETNTTQLPKTSQELSYRIKTDLKSLEKKKKKKKKKKKLVENLENCYQAEVAVDYADVGGSIMYPKFVVADRTDIQEAGRAVQEYKVLVSPRPSVHSMLGWKK